jgi:DNA polymerase-1
MNKRELLILIDGTSLAYRAFFAFIKNPLRNSKGENTSAAFAFTNSLLKLLKSFNPDYAAIIFDSKGPTFRHEKFEEYKATRPKMPSDLSYQLKWIREIGEGLGFPVMEVPGYEADDVLAKLALEAEDKGYEVLLVTSDKDLLQIIDENIKSLDTRPKEDILYTPQLVREKFGVPPEKIPDLIALVGDPIDNIPGVPGIGDKTARMLIEKFGSLENIYNSLEEIERKNIREILLKFKDQAFLSKELAKLNLDVPISLNPEDLTIKPPDRRKLFQLFRRLEFASLMAEMADFPKDIVIQEIEELGKELPGALSFTIADGYLYFTDNPNLVKKIPLEKSLQLLKETRDKAVFSAKEEYRKSLKGDYEIGSISFDLMLADYLLEPGKPRYDLEFLALQYLGFKVHSDMERRAAETVSIVQRLKDSLLFELKEKDLLKLYDEIELPLTKVLAKMEHHGVLIDGGKLKEMDLEIQKEILRLEEEIYNIAGTKFNLNSPRQLSYILFDVLKLPPVKKTKTGYSTDSEVLLKLAEKHELPRKILEYRELFKIRSTYIVSLLQLQDPISKRIHPTFNQTGTATGRLSCSEPNLQNIPIRSEIGKRIRRAFIAPKGYLLLSADYSQIELRILAHITGDENLIKAFKEDMDIHRSTAASLWKKRPEQVTDMERRKAKVVNFGITYGMSPYGLSKELNISVEEASQIIFAYFATYPNVKRWIEEILEEARDKGYVKTLLGRRRYIPEIREKRGTSREFSERIAINAPIQGTAADLIKKAMVEIDGYFEREKIPAHLILQVHDELLFEVKEELIGEVANIVKNKMETALKLRVPLKVELGWGEDWLSAHP